MANHASPMLGDLPVADIGLIQVRNVLEPIWLEKPTTAKALQGRLEKILGWAAVHGYRDPAVQNPAQWSGYLDQILQPIGKVKERTGKGGSNFPSVHYEEIPDFVRLLRNRNGLAARALEFTILTAARTREVIGDKRENDPGMTWKELDLCACLWTVPKARMKMNRDHKVPLCDRALAILKAVPPGGPDERVFPGPRGQIASDGYMRSVIKRIQKSNPGKFNDRMTGRPATTHGFRATFKTWAKDCTEFEREAVELSLSHVEKNKAVKAYDRADMITKRRELMAEWSNFCDRGVPVKDDLNP